MLIQRVRVLLDWLGTGMHVKYDLCYSTVLWVY